MISQLPSQRGDGGRLKWLTRISAPAMVLLIISATAFAVVARFTSMWEPSARTVLRSELADFHTGAGPCLRYADEPDAGSLAEAVEALTAAGFGSREVAEVRGDVEARLDLLEAPHHSKGEVDEHLDLMFRHGGLVTRAALAIKGERYRQTLTFWVSVAPRATGALAGLPEGRRAAIESQVARDPTIFTYPGIWTLLDLLAVEVTSRRLDRVRLQLEQRAESGEEVAMESLGISWADQSDEWSGTFELERRSEGLVLMSLGRDGRRGGTGADSDLVRVIRGTKALE